MNKIYIAVALLLMCGSLPAQEDSLKPKQLEEVMVVTGQYKPQSIKNSVYQVRVISKERIQKQGATKLQDVLNSELNMRFSQDLPTGGSDISMMGLSGQNVKILVDGMPMIGRQGLSNEININQIDVNSIERIEIIEGPMSVIYGADALAGVINIITKRSPGAKISVSARLHEESIGKEYGIKQGIHNQYAGLTWRYKKWDIGGGIGRNYFGGWKDTAWDRELVWHKKDQVIGNGSIGFTDGKFNIRYRFDGLDEIITNPGNFGLNAEPASGDTLAHDQEYLTRRLMQQLQASWFINADLSFQAQASYTNFSRQVFSTTVSKKTGDVKLDPASQSIVDFTGFTFRTTAIYKLSHIISFQPGVDLNLESGKGERLQTGNNKVNDFAFFITSEITPSSRISIRPGFRFMKNSVYNAPPVIPSINAKFVLSKQFDFRLAYARGFRAPSLRELYFNFFDANHQIKGNPDLKAETSHSLTGSLSWKPVRHEKLSASASLSGFYNNVRNLIDFAPSAADPNIYVYINIAESKTRGINLTGNLNHKNWNASLGTSYTGFYNIYAITDKSLPEIQWSAEINSNLGYSFSRIGLDINLFYKYTGKRPGYTVNNNQVIIPSRLKGYHMADLTFNKKLLKYLILNAGIRNLFDVDRVTSTAVSSGVHTPNGTRNIGCGRSVFAGVVFNWEKK